MTYSTFRRAAGALIVAVLASGCSDGDNASSLPANRTTMTTVGTTTTTALPDAYKVGETVTFGSGGTMTIKAWEQDTKLEYDAHAGHHYSAAQVEQCRGAKGQTSETTSGGFAFQLMLKSNERVEGSERKDPAMSETVYAPGECVVGALQISNVTHPTTHSPGCIHGFAHCRVFSFAALYSFV